MNTKLDVKQLAIATLAVFVAMTIFALIMNKLVFTDEAVQATTDTSWTPRILVYLSRLIWAGLFTFIFTKVLAGTSGIVHGLRYGLGMGLFLYVPVWLNGFAGFAFVGWSTSQQTNFMLIGLAQSVVSGAIVAQLCKPKQA